MQRVDELRNTVIPRWVRCKWPKRVITVPRPTTARKKLIQKLLFATASVVALVFFALGLRRGADRWRGRGADAGGHAVCLWGLVYAERVSLFALIFSIGILADAIVVVENIHRHQALHPDKTLLQLIPGAVDEGRAHHYATFTVIAALLPMAFVSADGAVHGSYPHQRQHGHGDFAGRGVYRHALAGALWMKNHSATHIPATRQVSAKLTPLFERIFTPLLDEHTGGRNRSLLGLAVVGLIALSMLLPVLGLGAAEDAAV